MKKIMFAIIAIAMFTMVGCDIAPTYYTATFTVDGAVIDEQVVLMGETAVAPADPTPAAGYSFAGWSPSVSTAIVADTNFVAQWTDLYDDMLVNTVWTTTVDGTAVAGASKFNFADNGIGTQQFCVTALMGFGAPSAITWEGSDGVITINGINGTYDIIAETMDIDSEVYYKQ